MRLAVLPRLRDRVHSDFLMESRLRDYGRLLEAALRAGYQINSVEHVWRLMGDGGLDPTQRHLVLRHDVDTDPRTAAAMWDIDRGLGVESSYFFRLSTLAPELMADIAGGGSGASYHYEELSTVAKRRGLRSRSDALAHVPEAREEFAENLGRLRATTGLPMRVVASHGDFVNRRLGIANWAILDDPEFRRSVDVDLETYDEAFLRHLPSRHSDEQYPRYWDYHDPAEAIRAGEPVIYILVHPRHWRADRRVNARDDIRRAVEGLRFEVSRGRRRHGVSPAMTPGTGPDPGIPAGATSGQPSPGRGRQRVGMALYGDLTYDSRVRREARTLAGAGYDVTLVCLAAQAGASDLPENVKVLVQRPPGTAVIPGSSNPFFSAHGGRLAGLRARVAWLVAYVRGLRAWGRLAVETAGPVDVWHAHDLTGLAAIVPNLSRGVPVVFDSHELFLETGTALRLPLPARLMLRAYERRLVSRVTAVITVNEALAAVLRRRHRRQEVLAVHNCPDRWLPPAERPTVLREAAGVSGDAPVILYHGALSPHRGVEQLMQVLLEPGLEDAHLVLMGFGELKEDFVRASAEARWENRVHVLEPVRPTELLLWVASADIGAMPIQPSTLNLRLSTPNKLFECLAAGTPVVASDFPAIRRIVVGDPSGVLGAVCDPADVRSIAEAIGSILRLAPTELAELRRRCRRAADERWNWELEARTLLAVYEGVLSRRG